MSKIEQLAEARERREAQRRRENDLAARTDAASVALETIHAAIMISVAAQIALALAPLAALSNSEEKPG